MKEVEKMVEKKCAYCGSTHRVVYSKKYGDYLCGKHYQQVNKKGYCYKTYRDPNDFEIVDDKTVYILAYKGQFSEDGSNELYKVIVDIEDLGRLLKYKWFITKEGYAYSGSKIGAMHRLILNCTDKTLYVDHINHDRLDNRKSNLRVVTPQQNCWNSASFKGKSKFKGVKIYNSDNKYTYYFARGCLNNHTVHIGVYKTELEAAYAYNLWVREHFGEFANENIFTNEEWELLSKALPLRTVYEHNKEHATSKYKYINYVKRFNRWAYERTINKVKYKKATFLTEEDAHDAYIEKMKELGVEP